MYTGNDSTGGAGGYGGSGGQIKASNKDGDDRKIFVGGLSWESTEADLRSYFEKFGSVTDVTIKTDFNTGRSRGFGFVLFADSSTVDKVVADRNHILHGKQIDPKRAVAGGSEVSGGVKKIFVGGIDPSQTEEDVKNVFSQYGTVALVELPFDRIKNQRRAFGFVTFESEDAVDRICQNAKVPYGDKMVDIRKAVAKDQQNCRGGGRGGFMRGRGRGGPGQMGGYGGGMPGGYDAYNGYGGGAATGYPGYDYYGGQAPGSQAPYGGGYDPSGYGMAQQGWGGGYDQSAQAYGGQPAAGGYGGGYDYSGGWQSGDAAGGYGKMKRGGGGGSGAATASHGYAGGYHPYSR